MIEENLYAKSSKDATTLLSLAENSSKVGCEVFAD